MVVGVNVWLATFLEVSLDSLESIAIIVF